MTEKVVQGHNDAIERLVGGNQTNRGNRMSFPSNTDSRGTRAHHASGDVVGHYAEGETIRDHLGLAHIPGLHIGIRVPKEHEDREKHGYGESAGYGDDSGEDSSGGYGGYAPKATPKADARSYYKMQGAGRKDLKGMGLGKRDIRKEKRGNGGGFSLSNIANKASSAYDTVNKAAKTAGDMYGKAKGMYDEYAPQAQGLYNQAKNKAKGSRFEGAVNKVGEYGSKFDQGVNKANDLVKQGRGYANDIRSGVEQGKEMFRPHAAGDRVKNATHAVGDTFRGAISGIKEARANRDEHAYGDRVEAYSGGGLQQRYDASEGPGRYGPVRSAYGPGRSGRKDFKQDRKNFRTNSGVGFGNFLNNGMNMMGEVAKGAGQVAGAMGGMRHGGYVEENREHYGTGGAPYYGG